MSEPRNSVRINLLANYVGQGWIAIMNLAFIPVYLSMLGIDAYGLVGIFAIVVAGTSLLDAAVTPALNREMARFRAGEQSPQSIADLLRSVELVSGAFIGAVIAVGWLSADWLTEHWLTKSPLSQTSVSQALVLMSIVASSRVAEGIYRGALFGLERHVLLNGTMIVLSTVRSGGAALALIWIAPTIQTFFIWQATASCAGLAVLAALTHRALPKPPRRAAFSRSALAEIRNFSAGILGTAMLALLLTQGDKVLLAKILPLKLFAYYTLATIISNALYQLIGPVAQSYYPRFTEITTRGAKGELATIYHQAAQVLTVAVAPAAMLLVFFSDQILLLWTGNHDVAEQAGPVLSLLAIGTLVNGLQHIPYMLQLSRGWSSLAARVNLAAMLIMFPTLLWLVPKYAGMGAAAIWLVLNVLCLVVTIHLMHRRVLKGEAGAWYRRDVISIVGAAALPTLVSRLFWSASADLPLKIGLLVLTFAIASIASLLAASELRGRVLALAGYRHAL